MIPPHESACVDDGATASESPMGRRLGSRLLALLKKELVQQHRLLGVATHTREAIVERDIACLTRLKEQHTLLLGEAERLAAQRMEMSRAIVGGGGKDDDITLSHVADNCTPRVALEMGVVRDRLVELAAQVQNAHLLNRQLLENELDYIGASLEVLARAVVPRKNYTAPSAPLDAFAIFLDKAA